MLERLRTDWPLKVVALVLAFGIWASITGQGRTLRDFTVPLEIDLGEEHIATTPPPTEVMVRLEGLKNSIRKLDPLRLAVHLDLQDSPAGEREIQFSEADLQGVPQGVEVSFFRPDRLGLVVDRRVKRKLEVRLDLVGEPPAGRALYDARVFPETIVVEGPEAALDAMETLQTDPISLDRRRDSFVTTVNVVPEDPQVQLLIATPLEARVLIDDAPVEVIFDQVPVTLRGNGVNATIQPPSVRVTLSGPPALVRKVQLGDVTAMVEMTVAQPGQQQRTAVRGEVGNLEPSQRGLVWVSKIQPSHVTLSQAREDGS